MVYYNVQCISRDVACRIIGVMWGFFALFMLIFYTLYLCSVLSTVKVDGEHISNVEDLVASTNIKYGCVNGGSTMQFFKDSEYKTYMKIYELMMANPSVLARSNEEGSKKVLEGKGKYAFFMESPAIEYLTERNCELTEVGHPLDDRGYGIAMAKSIYITNLVLCQCLRNCYFRFTLS